MSISNGYTQIPQGVYFSDGDMTVTVWVRPKFIINYQSLIDFTDFPVTNRVQIGLSYQMSGEPYFRVFNSTTSSYSSAGKNLTLNEWCYLSFVIAGQNKKIYINATLVANNIITVRPTNVTRTINYIGKSYSTGYPNMQADIDELKFFNRALTQQEIQFEMNNNMFV